MHPVYLHLIWQHWLLPTLEGVFLGLVAMALHEAGHILMARAVGIKVRRVGLSWQGMFTVREPGPPAKNLLVSFAGPLVNLLLMALWPWLPLFSLANLCVGACNLLPIRGSDGDRMLTCWSEMREAASRARTPREVRPEEPRRAA